MNVEECVFCFVFILLMLFVLSALSSSSPVLCAFKSHRSMLVVRRHEYLSKFCDIQWLGLRSCCFIYYLFVGIFCHGFRSLSPAPPGHLCLCVRSLMLISNKSLCTLCLTVFRAVLKSHCAGLRTHINYLRHSNVGRIIP